MTKDHGAFVIGAVPAQKTPEILMERLLNLQGSIDALAWMVCQDRVDDVLKEHRIDATDEYETSAVQEAYQGYQSLAQEKALSRAFSFSERFPLEPKDKAN